MNKLFEKWRQTVKMSAYLLTYLLALNHPFHNVSYLAAVFPYILLTGVKKCVLGKNKPTALQAECLFFFALVSRHFLNEIIT